MFCDSAARARWPRHIQTTARSNKGGEAEEGVGMNFDSVVPGHVGLELLRHDVGRYGLVDMGVCLAFMLVVLCFVVVLTYILLAHTCKLARVNRRSSLQSKPGAEISAARWSLHP